MASRAGGGNAKDSSSPESGGADFAAISVDGWGVGGSIIRGIFDIVPLSQYERAFDVTIVGGKSIEVLKGKEQESFEKVCEVRYERILFGTERVGGLYGNGGIFLLSYAQAFRFKSAGR